MQLQSLERAATLLYYLRTTGGAGSGNFGHAGRPGEIGGSAEGDNPKRKELVDQVRERSGVSKKRKEVDRVADQMGFPKENIHFVDMSADRYNLNGYEFEAEGRYKHGDRVIEISPSSRLNNVSSVAAHEITHDAFAQVYQGYRPYFEPGSASFGREPDNTPKEVKDFFDHLYANKEQLYREDGVTDYSEDYWKQAAHSMIPKHDTEIAWNETLAEISGAKESSSYTGLPLSFHVKKEISPVWSGLHDRLFKAYRAVESHRKQYSPLFQKVKGRAAEESVAPTDTKLQRMEVAGKPATVAFLSELGGSFVGPKDAGIVVVRFDDGSVSYLRPASLRSAVNESGSDADNTLTDPEIGSASLRSAVKVRETLVHTAADSNYGKIKNSVKYGFAAGRKKLPKTIRKASDVEPAIEAMANALLQVLPDALAKTVIAGGTAGAEMLTPQLKAAGGAGSGNFGHAGRPGEVGGSSAAGDFFHFPANFKLEDAQYDVHTKFPRDKMVVAKVNLDLLSSPYPKDWRVEQMMQAIKDGKKFPPVTLEQYPDKLSILDGNTRIAAFRELGIKGQIPAVIRLYGDDSPLPDGVAVDEKRTASLRRELRAAGGPGSGDFGHKGRPGEIGGSSSEGGNFTDTEDAVMSYALSSYGLAEALRSAAPLTPQQESQVKLIDSAMKPLRSQVLYRGVDPEYAKTLKEGDLITDKAYVSTSKDHEAAQIFGNMDTGDVTVLVIDVPSGTMGLDINKTFASAKDAGQHEVILERGTTFRVKDTSDFFPDDPQFGAIKLEVVPKQRALAGPFRYRFDAKNPNVSKWAREHAADLVQGITETVRNKVRDSLARALDDQLSDSDLYDELSNELGDDYDADRIARTESMKAANQGQKQSWDQAVESGLLTGDEQRTWIATADKATCPICDELDGQTADMDGEYDSSYVGGLDGPPAHPNCRCTEGLVS